MEGNDGEGEPYVRVEEQGEVGTVDMFMLTDE